MKPGRRGMGQAAALIVAGSVISRLPGFLC